MFSGKLQSATAGAPAAYIEDVFSTYTYKPAADFTNYSINNGIDLAGKGGMTWFKARNAASNNLVYDTVRGSTSGSPNALITNGTQAQQTAYFDYVTPTATGFNVSFLSGGAQLTNGGINYTSWTFRKQPKFFDVVTYTGTGSAQNIPHSLGSVPGVVIVKPTSAAQSWAVWHRSIANTEYLFLNDTAAKATNVGMWNSTTPTSTDFTVGGSGNTNSNGVTYVAYLFAHNAGGFGSSATDNVISCGSFTLDGSNTAIVTLGYEPQWVMIKRTNLNSNWVILDNMRGLTTSGVDAALRPNTSSAETNGQEGIYPTATGFGANTGLSSSGDSYIYIAIRRGPMKVPTDGTKVYDAKLYTGAGTNPVTISGISMVPDLVQNFVRNFSTGQGAIWIDRLRGGARNLEPRSTSAENMETAATATFDNMTTVTLSGGDINATSYTYVNHFFRRAPGFFDEVCYTGTGVTATKAHNLTVVPELFIVKRRDGVNDWYVYSNAEPQPFGFTLNSASRGTAVSVWNNTAPTSSVFTVSGNAAVNGSGATYVAYLFATCPGVSKVGSYTGTGASQVINCGFTAGARFVLIKRTDSTGGWYTYDTARGMVTGTDPHLLINTNAAEVNADYVFTSSTGFTIQAAAPAEINASGGSYIFLAIA